MDYRLTRNIGQLRRGAIVSWERAVVTQMSRKLNLQPWQFVIPTAWGEAASERRERLDKEDRFLAVEAALAKMDKTEDEVLAEAEEVEA